MSAAGMPPIDDPAHDGLAVELGKVILWERAQLPPVVLGQCEERWPCPRAGQHARSHCPYGCEATSEGQTTRCRTMGMLCELSPALPTEERFLCPKHGATLERAVRRYPR